MKNWEDFTTFCSTLKKALEQVSKSDSWGLWFYGRKQIGVCVIRSTERHNPVFFILSKRKLCSHLITV